jgi:cyclic pyranopterin phosphate synthase
MGLSHLDQAGKARMVDVSSKEETLREARAEGLISLGEKAFQAVRENRAAKGDVLATARLAGIMAAKKTPELIPLCHPLPISSVGLDFELIDEEGSRGVKVLTRARTRGQTGVEMEALTAASVALLTVYDMLKAIDKSMVIGPVRLTYKSGGKSGVFKA